MASLMLGQSVSSEPAAPIEASKELSKLTAITVADEAAEDVKIAERRATGRATGIVAMIGLAISCAAVAGVLIGTRVSFCSNPAQTSVSIIVQRTNSTSTEFALRVAAAARITNRTITMPVFETPTDSSADEVVDLTAEPDFLTATPNLMPSISDPKESLGYKTIELLDTTSSSAAGKSGRSSIGRFLEKSYSFDDASVDLLQFLARDSELDAETDGADAVDVDEDDSDSKQASGRKVIGSDGRLQVPWSVMQRHRHYMTVVQLSRKDANGVTFGCSGMLIGKSTILTAAHCVYENGKWLWPTEVRMKVVDGKKGYKYTPKKMLTFTAWTTGRAASHDMAAIIVHGEPSRRFGHMGIAFHSSNSHSMYSEARISGYPCDKDRTRLYTMVGSAWVSSADSNRLRYLTDTFGCQSGSGIVSTHRSYSNHVIGVHTSGSYSYNEGTRFQKDVFNHILNWRKMS